MPTGYKTPLERKLRYVEEIASREGIDLSMLKWEYELDEILKNISFNINFNFLLNIYLNLDLHFDMPSLDFEMPDFTDLFSPPFEKIGKAQYGVSQYNLSIYDPEQVTSQSLHRLLWDLRYKLTDVDGATIKLTSEAAKQWIEQLKQYLTEKGVANFYQDAMFEILALVEGKMSSVSYWDIAVFDVSVWSEEDKFRTRYTDDWRSEKELETTGVFDNHFDFCRFDFARFGDVYEGGTIKVSEELGEDLARRIDEFHKRSGWIEQYGQKTIYQRIFFYQKQDKMHWQGGHHQIRLQNLLNHIKRMLNEKGVIAQFRTAYLAFAQELFYHYYEPHRKYKQWRKILSQDELKNKYKRMGCDVEILDEIKEVVEKWR
ncbi:hypothetical protein DRN97_04205 [Methanosarcinales archaeon]|nr:MAG: hypothetical protein DRN97_04205 [Methanosarcinales archaeon]